MLIQDLNLRRSLNYKLNHYQYVNLKGGSLPPFVSWIVLCKMNKHALIEVQNISVRARVAC